MEKIVYEEEINRMSQLTGLGNPLSKWIDEANMRLDVKLVVRLVLVETGKPPKKGKK